jgi:hypothetical protein
LSLAIVELAADSFYRKVLVIESIILNISDQFTGAHRLNYSGSCSNPGTSARGKTQQDNRCQSHQEISDISNVFKVHFLSR